MARPRSIPGLSEDLPYGEAAARAIQVRAGELAEHASGVLDTADIERVHDMRVATRRLRAALEIFEPCLPRKRARAALKEVKALADALGERRDRDVQIAELERFSSAVAAADRPGIASLIDRLRSEQEAANRDLAPRVEPQRVGALVDRLEALAREAEGARR